MTKNNFIDWLKQKHATIMACEQSGLALMANGDIAGYREKMRQKAEMLATLLSDANKAGIPKTGDTDIESQLKRFSSSAETALGLDSVFYMSALLYPDDHKKGDPDNLELFIKDLEWGESR